MADTVANLEIQKGGLSHWRAKRARKFWVATPTFSHAGSNSRPSQMSGDE